MPLFWWALRWPPSASTSACTTCCSRTPPLCAPCSTSTLPARRVFGDNGWLAEEVDMNGFGPRPPAQHAAYLAACFGVSNATLGKILPPVMSARVSTRRSTSIKFECVEIRAKLPTGDWLWRALWMLPVEDAYGGWPFSGERRDRHHGGARERTFISEVRRQLCAQLAQLGAHDVPQRDRPDVRLVGVAPRSVRRWAPQKYDEENPPLSTLPVDSV
ncbi:hypothetical protein C8J57DRAFT_759937 [Mycena rebaudengoi]|nr:hypothetical protein C8J57DRAFT_759937 [Mycena rebaudengoi]